MNDVNTNTAADWAAIFLAVGTYIFLCYLIYDTYQRTGMLDTWMLGSLITMLMLSLGTLFGFGRLGMVLEKLPVTFGKK